MHEVTNDSQYWRAFDENQLTHSVAHYLMAVDRLKSENGYARVTDVASMLDISRGAASLALSQLKERGLVTEDPNRFLLLTEEGVRLARRVENNFVLLTRFFEDVLGIDSKTAREDACKMEHLLSETSSRALLQFLQTLFSKPRWVKTLTTEMKETDVTCSIDELCSICKPIGECIEGSMTDDEDSAKPISE